MENLRAYYLGGLESATDRNAFERMIGEMAHLERLDQVAAWAHVYRVHGYSPVAVAAAIGFVQKRIERGLR